MSFKVKGKNGLVYVDYKFILKKMTFRAFLDHLNADDVQWISTQINLERNGTMINKVFDITTSINLHQLRIIPNDIHFKLDYF